MKYELIKEYPGTPELGTIATPYKNDCDKTVHYTVTHPTDLGAYLALPKKDIENNPEYWEKVNDNIWYIVSEEDYKQFDTVFFEKWNVYKVESYEEPTLFNSFKTREHAEEFIRFNKPCLSHSDLICYFYKNTEKNIIEVNIDGLVKLIKSRL